jgi:hypothetical protein
MLQVVHHTARHVTQQSFLELTLMLQEKSAASADRRRSSCLTTLSSHLQRRDSNSNVSVGVQISAGCFSLLADRSVRDGTQAINCSSGIADIAADVAHARRCPAIKTSCLPLLLRRRGSLQVPASGAAPLLLVNRKRI